MQLILKVPDGERTRTVLGIFLFSSSRFLAACVPAVSTSLTFYLCSGLSCPPHQLLCPAVIFLTDSFHCSAPPSGAPSLKAFLFCHPSPTVCRIYTYTKGSWSHSRHYKWTLLRDPYPVCKPGKKCAACLCVWAHVQCCFVSPHTGRLLLLVRGFLFMAFRSRRSHEGSLTEATQSTSRAHGTHVHQIVSFF